MTTICFQHIPVDLFREIQCYSTFYDYWQWMNTSLSLFSLIKKETIQFKFRFDARKGTEHLANFLLEIQSNLLKVKDSSLQFHLAFEANAEAVAPALLSLCRYRSLQFGGYFYQLGEELFRSFLLNAREKIQLSAICKTLPTFPTAATGAGEGVEEGPPYPQKFISFHTVSDPSTFTNVSYLANLHELILMDCANLTHLACLGKIKKLSIIKCPRVTDLTGLGQVPDLTIQACQNLIDLSPLSHHNHKLRILFCLNIKKGLKSIVGVQYLKTDIKLPNVFFPQLTQIRSLSIYWLSTSKLNLSSFAYSHLKILNFEAQKGAFHTILPEFATLFKISFWGGAFSSKETFQFIHSVPVVELTSINNLKSLNGLGGNKMVKITQIDSVTTFRPLKNIPHVILIACDGLKTVKELENVQSLEIYSCRNLKDVKSLGMNVQHLILEDCAMNSFDGLSRVPCLELKWLRWNSAFMKSINFDFVENKKIVIPVPPELQVNVFDSLIPLGYLKFMAPEATIVYLKS